MNEEVKFYRYYLPSENGEGYAIIFLDSTGVFSAVSDFGNYGYIWQARGGVEFRRWLVDNHHDWHYFAKKFDPKQIADWDQTVKHIREHIDAYAKEGTYTKAFARNERDLLARHSTFSSELDFSYWYNETKISDAYELIHYRMSYQVEHFAKKTLVRLCAILKAEIEVAA